MGRAPCCEKMGLKKGPWTPEEDQILISYIQEHGHGNWRALPKQAGLLRCGKSCRLRWINYLRPDIKRGNFTKEEEDTIIKLHEHLGNRWSAIAARLPGRTDNEIKNVWHTHIKKKLQNYHSPRPTRRHSSTMCSKVSMTAKTTPAVSPQDSSSEISTITDSSALNMDSSDYFPQIDETFWSEETSSSVAADSPAMNNCSNDDGDQMVIIRNEEMDSSMYIRHNADESLWYQKQQKDYSVNQSDFQEDSKFEIFPKSNMMASPMEGENVCVSGNEDDMDFWFNLFIRAEDLPELPEF